jgi:UDP-N-acetylmuramoyl-tripeptide--D-alanyl-D-alanine ligase
MKLTAIDLRKIPHCELRVPEGAARWSATGVSTDSRTVARGMLFVALRGQKFDGHRYLADAVARGAAGLVVDVKGAGHAPVTIPVLVVEDTAAALAALARQHRERFDIPVIAVGGSNGKTTTKDMIARVLATRYTVLATQGNLNNQIGVPQTLFGLDRTHDVAVVEVGTNHPGELAALCRILKPTHALLTNLGHEHLEFFGSLEGVVEEETMLWRWAEHRKGMPVFINADDPLSRKAAAGLTRLVSFGFTTRGVRVRGSSLRINDRGCAVFRFRGGRMRKPAEVALSVPGIHNAYNALAAAAVGLTMRVPAVDIVAALEGFHAASKRMEVIRIGDVTVLNDTYNANADSAIAGLHTLAATSSTGKRIAVLADMLELGNHSAGEHARVGATAAKLHIDYVLTYGTWAAEISRAAAGCSTAHYDQKNMLAEYLAELVSPGDVVLIKGSRGMAMEDILIFLQQRLETALPSV